MSLKFNVSGSVSFTHASTDYRGPDISWGVTSAIHQPCSKGMTNYVRNRPDLMFHLEVPSALEMKGNVLRTPSVLFLYCFN
jgi:hypothetical protein